MINRFVTIVVVGVVLFAVNTASAQGVPHQLQQIQDSLTIVTDSLATITNSLETITSIVNSSGDGKQVITQNSVLAAGGFPYQITQPGSYRLGGHLTVPANTDAIQIQTDHVTIDLSGFTITGSGGVGITAPNAQSFITVANGTLHGFGNGIFLSGNGNPTRIERMTVRGGGGGGGISAGDRTTIVDSNVSFVGGTGIFAGHNSIVRGNVVTQSRSSGIVVHDGSIVSGNTTGDNEFYGISADCPSVLTGNTSVGNTLGPVQLFGASCARADNAGF